MINVNNVIENADDLQKHYVIRDGFVFTSITEPSNVYDAIVIRYPESCDCFTPKVGFSNHSLGDCINLINEYNIEKALIIADDINFITQCLSLKCIEIVPSETAGNFFDYTPLYDMPNIEELDCKTSYGRLEQFSTTIDYSKMKRLKKISVCGSGHKNYVNVQSLESLRLSYDKSITDLNDISNMRNLKVLDIVQCSGLQSLDGIELLKSLEYLNVGYCRKLQNVSALSSIGQTLKILIIENCHKIEDFGFLKQMTNLHRLSLEGKNNLPNLCFLKKMKSLNFLFLWMNVLDGDITPCLNIPYVSLANHKHYNMKDKDLSKKLM